MTAKTCRAPSTTPGRQRQPSPRRRPKRCPRPSAPQKQTASNYLNNRYQDPTTGVFLSVDPLVATTGTPYLYGNGNPTTFSDPTGLCGQAYVPIPCTQTEWAKVQQGSGLSGFNDEKDATALAGRMYSGTFSASSTRS